MRVSCEVCQQVQPPYWQPGDLCITCGSAVQRQHRCYWCTELTPGGNFCRHCGATQVADEQYGAGRWLKHLGADQFAIPERLGSIPPEQVEHFTRLYQRHAAVADRHVDDLALAESYARYRGWARSLEESLLPQLPLPDAELAALALPPRQGGSPAEQLAEIRDSSPYGPTRVLAALARLRLWQTQDALTRDDVNPDMKLLLNMQPPTGALGVEYALTLSHWRLAASPQGIHMRRPAGDGLYAAREQFPLESAVQSALLQAAGNGQPQPVPEAALAADDPDLAFAAALAAQVPEPLLGALRVPARRYPAAHALTRQRIPFDLLGLLPGFHPTEQDWLLQVIHSQQQPRPDLRPWLQQAAAGEFGREMVDRARGLLLLDLQPGDAERLLQAHPDHSFISKLLASPALTAPEVLALCRELVARSLFVPNRINSLHQLLVDGALPPDFVPGVYPTAPADMVQELRSVASNQLFNSQSLDTVAPLVEFLRRLQWQPDASLADQNWVSYALTNWYGGSFSGNRPALNFPPATVARYFRTYPEFVEELVRVLEHPAARDVWEAGHRYLRPLAEVRDVTDPALVAEPLAALPPALRARLLAALLARISQQTDYNTSEGILHLLGLLRQHPAWHPPVQAGLEALRGTYYEDQVQQLLDAA